MQRTEHTLRSTRQAAEAEAFRQAPAHGVCHHRAVDIEEVAAALRARRAELAVELERLTAPPEPGATVGFGKRIGDGTTEAVERFTSTATARSVSRALTDLDRALAKVSEGTYGVCDACGGLIPEERLAAMPATAHCVDCRRTLEG
jgi:DnaK suppressor protein